MTTARGPSDVVSTPLIAATGRRGRAPRARADSNLQTRLIRDFTIAILIPALVTTIVGARMIQQRVVNQAQADVNSDLDAAAALYQNQLDHLKSVLRIHAVRSVLYGPLAQRATAGLDAELGRILQSEQLDLLVLTDAEGRVFMRVRNPADAGTGPPWDGLVARVIRERAPLATTEVVAREELARESPALAEQARMIVTPTPRAPVTPENELTSGMMLCAAAPVLTPAGRFLGVLYGGVLLNRNYDFVDRVRETVFKGLMYEGHEVGTATIFQGDVRISTNVKDAGGTRAITTRASAEVADQVLDRGGTWQGRAFVVNDWYLAAYAPLRNSQGRTIGMLYVGTLERPYTRTLWRSLLVFLSIAAAGIVLVNWVAIRVARRISQPIEEISRAAQSVALGDYSPKVEVTTRDEIGHLATSFNAMTSELARAHQELREWGENLERKVAQRTGELETAQARLLQSAKLAAVGRLAAGVAHEINNPLTGILTNSSIMLEDLEEGDPRREELQTIVNETLRCRKIVKGLLDFARQTRPQKQKLSLNQVAEDVLALVRNQASFRNLTVTTDLDRDLPLVMADGDQLRQVVLNIVLNAADAMALRGGTLRITSRADAPAGTATLRVADTGAGIPDDVKDRLFEPFFTTKSTGTGLGLAIAYGIVEQHKGTLAVESAPGRGTTIVITLPVNGGGDHGGSDHES